MIMDGFIQFALAKVWTYFGLLDPVSFSRHGHWTQTSQFLMTKII